MLLPDSYAALTRTGSFDVCLEPNPCGQEGPPRGVPASAAASLALCHGVTLGPGAAHRLYITRMMNRRAAESECPECGVSEARQGRFRARP